MQSAGVGHVHVEGLHRLHPQGCLHLLVKRLGCDHALAGVCTGIADTGGYQNFAGMIRKNNSTWTFMHASIPVNVSSEVCVRVCVCACACV